jgi:hypothetical protein
MATEHLTEYPGSFQQLADARRVLRVADRLRSAPVLLADERLELERARALAIRCIEAATAELIETLDALHDPDVEANGDELDGSGSPEEDFGHHWDGIGSGPGCPLSDPDYAVDDLPCDAHDEGV